VLQQSSVAQNIAWHCIVPAQLVRGVSFAKIILGKKAPPTIKEDVLRNVRLFIIYKGSYEYSDIK
jgi:hypothetical protein